jgi:hypothetical protein
MENIKIALIAFLLFTISFIRLLELHLYELILLLMNLALYNKCYYSNITIDGFCFLMFDYLSSAIILIFSSVV